MYWLQRNFEKLLWFLMILLFIIIISGIFIKNRFIQTSQTFGPIPPSASGRDSPFTYIDIEFSCEPKEFYFSEDSDIFCKFLTKSKDGAGYNIGMTAKIYSIDDNQFFWYCTSSISSTGGFDKKEGHCEDSNGRMYFELPKGNYKINVSKFASSSPGLEVIHETAEDVIFRGTLHVMSSYEKGDKQVEDGVSLATFLAFLFIIPSAVLKFRHFICGENHKESNIIMFILIIIIVVLVIISLIVLIGKI